MSGSCTPGKKVGCKNLVGVYLSFILVYGLFTGIVYLQSSINSEGGLGLTSAIVVYIAKASSLIFVPSIYSRFGSKYSLILGYFLFIPYVLSNYYSSWYTLIPGSVFVGIGLSLVFVNSRTHCSETANQYASSFGESSSNAIALFLGLFGTSVKLGSLLGSVASSSILFNLNSDRYTNSSNNEDSNLTCTNTDALYVDQDLLYYILVTVFLVFGIAGIITAFVFMDNFGSDAEFISASKWFDQHIVQAVKGILKLAVNWKMLLLFPFSVVNGISIGFIAGTFPKVYVSDCLGVQWIGFVTSSYSISGAIAGIVLGRLYRYIPEFVLIYAGIFAGGGLTWFLIIWNREPNFFAVFGFAIGWGLCDGVWQSLLGGIIGATFPEKKNTAYTIFELGVSVGFVMSFTSGLFFSTVIHLCIIFCLISLVCVSYTTLIIIRKYQSRRSIDVNEDKSHVEMKNFNGAVNEPNLLQLRLQEQ